MSDPGNGEQTLKRIAGGGSGALDGVFGARYRLRPSVGAGEGGRGMKRLERSDSRTRLGLVMCLAWAALVASGRSTPAQAPEGSPTPGTELLPEAQEGTPTAEDPTRTAGGALRLFMASRHYQTIRQLRGAMTERLQARFDHDSAPFNGKRGNRLAAFDFAEKDLKPARTAGKQVTPASSYIASVRSLWEEQGEV